MLELRLHVVLKIQGPFLSKSSSVGGYGVDAVALRDALGRTVLPATQVRGRLRDALNELAVADGSLPDRIAQWFGPEVNREDDMPGSGPRPRGLVVSDFLGPVPAATGRPPSLTRIQIDRQTGAVKRGAMLMIEPAASPGDALELSGTVEFCEATRQELLDAVDRVYRGLLWIPAFGTFRSVGFGRLTGVRIAGARLCVWGEDEAAEARAVVEQLQALTGDRVPVETPSRSPPPFVHHTGDEVPVRWAVAVQIDEPFCVGQRRNDRNLVTSASYLSGAVLKGAVAASLLRIHDLPPRADAAQAITDGPWAELASVLDQLRFCSAFPAAAGGRQRPLWPRPESLVKDSEGRCFDVALCPGAFLFQTADGPCAPSFPLDWKRQDTGEWNSEWSEPGSEFRLHTAIDPKFRRARTNHLFSRQMILPEGYLWWGTVDLHRVPSEARPAIWKALAEFLERATLRIGKTKSRARMTMVEPFAGPSDLAAWADPAQPELRNLWVVVLQSPALLADPLRLSGRRDSDPLATEYENVWSELSDKRLRLERFFARQSLQGGFLASRAARASERSYEPFLVTDPGSVFVLRASGAVEDAQAEIEKWLNAGLRLPDWASKRYGDRFTTNPYLPQDGFGEIAVNLPVHRLLALPEVIRLD